MEENMGITEKLVHAKKTDWIVDGFSEAEIKTTVELAKISGQIERCRIDMHMSQKEFATYMGVSQSMVSKWESREYNFTIKALNEICEKLNLTLSVELDNSCKGTDYKLIKWDSERVIKKRSGNWVNYLGNKEAIA